MPKLKITDTSIRTQCVQPTTLTEKGNPKDREIYWDSATPCFGMKVTWDGEGRLTKTFIVQKKLPGTKSSRMIPLGKYGEITLTEARDKAAILLGKIQEGIDPRREAREAAEANKPQPWETFTLQHAIEEQVANMLAKEDAAASIHQLRHEIATHLPTWLNRPLSDITSEDCIEAHRRLSKKVNGRGGRVLANRVVKSVRACWNSARKRYPKLPPSPTFAVTFNKQHRVQSPIPWAQLPAFVAAVKEIATRQKQKPKNQQPEDVKEALSQRIRRDLQFTCLFTGARVTSVCELRWEHVDFDAGTIHFAKVKGGEDRAFTVPASEWLLTTLRRLKLVTQTEFGDTYVFPTRNRAGEVVPVQEPKEQRYFKDEATAKLKKRYFFQFTNAKGKKVNASPHRLRDTFATACMEAGVGFTETKVLMNHSLPNGSVTEGYQRPSIEHLRGCVEKVTTFLLKKAELETPAGKTVKTA